MEPSRYELRPGRRALAHLAGLVARDLDEGRTVILCGVGGAPTRTAFAVCQAATPVMATDSSGATRPWHPIVKETDRGDVTGSTEKSVPFELVLRRVVPQGLPSGSELVIEGGSGRHYVFV